MNSVIKLLHNSSYKQPINEGYFIRNVCHSAEVSPDSVLLSPIIYGEYNAGDSRVKKIHGTMELQEILDIFYSTFLNTEECFVLQHLEEILVGKIE